MYASKSKALPALATVAAAFSVWSAPALAGEDDDPAPPPAQVTPAPTVAPPAPAPTPAPVVPVAPAPTPVAEKKRSPSKPKSGGHEAGTTTKPVSQVVHGSTTT